MKAAQGELFQAQSPEDGTIVVNERCQVRVQGGHCLVLGSGIPLLHFGEGDTMARAHAIVNLVEQGWATQVEVAGAFGYTTRTIRRFQRRFEEGGLASLGRLGGYPAGRPRLRENRARLIGRLKAEGLSQRAIAARVGITENAVRKTLRRLGWKATPAPSLPLDVLPATGGAPSSPPTLRSPAPDAHPNLSGRSINDRLPVSMDRDPAHRTMDRLFAYMGLLDDAAPLFQPGSRVPRAGVLLAVPALLATGVLQCAREIYGSIGPAFYGLRTSIVAFVLLALLRIKRPEALKEHSPQDLGRILGLDRAPEVKTLRRKLARLAAAGRAADFGRALARRRVASHGHATGFLYVDGHVRVYHGLHEIPHAHVARMRIANRATTDYWVNDTRGEPLFVVTAEANAGLVKVLPSLLVEIRELVGRRRVTVVFDRGGWSPKLFQSILERGFDILTYRKGHCRRVAKRHFATRKVKIDGRSRRYILADQGVVLRGKGLYLRLRQVTRLMESGHQTPIITSRRDLSAGRIAYHMFERWRQENFFKYLREEYALDALVEYAVEPTDAERDVPNPAWKAVTATVRAARAEVDRLCAVYGVEALNNSESARRTMRGFKIAHAKEGRAVQAAIDKLARLQQRRKKIPSRVPVAQVVEGEVVKLATERQHLSNILKMVAYQAESDLVRRIRPVYRRVDQEGRTLIQAALSSAADIDVDGEELRVTLAPLSSAHRSRAVQALCEELDRASVRFPGTHLRMRFAVAPAATNRTIS
jgi:prepilin-type processing-associated H-X9-DG protein